MPVMWNHSQTAWSIVVTCTLSVHFFNCKLIQVSGMGLRSFLISAVPVFCVGVLSSQLAVAAVAVEINDGNGGVLCSGSLVDMSTTTNQVTVGMDGNCGSGSGNLVSSQIDMGSIDEGSYTALTKTIFDGVMLTPPIAIQLDLNNPPMQGTVASISAADDLTYNVSYSTANVRVDSNTLDSFGVIVSDAAGQSATLTFSVTVNDVAAPPPPPTGDCTPTTTIICKGDLDLTTNGEQYYVPIDLNTTQVWVIAPDKRGSYEAFSFRYLTDVMTVSVSENYAVDSTVEFCTKQVASGSLYLNEIATYGQCHVDPNKTYYLRVTSPKSGSYSVFY